MRVPCSILAACCAVVAATGCGGTPTDESVEVDLGEVEQALTELACAQYPDVSVPETLPACDPDSATECVATSPSTVYGDPTCPKQYSYRIWGAAAWNPIDFVVRWGQPLPTTPAACATARTFMVTYYLEDMGGDPPVWHWRNMTGAVGVWSGNPQTGTCTLDDTPLANAYNPADSIWAVATAAQAYTYVNGVYTYKKVTTGIREH
jgi:hypothetical protein